MAAVALAGHQLDDPLVKAAIAQVAHALGQTGVLTGQQIEQLLGPNMVAWLEHGEDSLMQRLAVKAAVSEVTDLGEFEAIAATYDVDRVKDQIVFGAFKRTIAAWRGSGKRLPVHWNHRAKRQTHRRDRPGHDARDPRQGPVRQGPPGPTGLRVAREAWRSMKNNAVALSFGYLATKKRKRADGIQDLLEIDLFEITVCPGPANPETRFLSMKGVANLRVPTDGELRVKAKRLGLKPPLSRRELRQAGERVALDAALGFEPAPKVDPEPAKSVPTKAELQRRHERQRLEILTGEKAPARAPARTYDAERARGRALMFHLLTGDLEDTASRTRRSPRRPCR